MKRDEVLPWVEQQLVDEVAYQAERHQSERSPRWVLAWATVLIALKMGEA